ncbi:MAG TPA: bifunctional riboflavin kinase/FAD synthetase [Thermoanaerobaculia bacterium]|nr:bifunctional riboflavin kinase/FAD synthetase [Thermoanaerobaculia bacterium]
MQVVRDPLRSTDLPRGGVGTIGNFDGVHLGHRKILETVVARARAVERPSFAITFEPHPMVVLRPDQAPRRIQTLRQKEEAIEALGIDALLVIPFTRDFSLTEPEDFIRALLRDRLGASEVLVGAHFAFGRGKRGDLALLTRLGAECGFSASAVDEVEVGGAPVSSTRIRRALERGSIVEANGMLGRDYELDGLVARGDRLGHQIGVPTINLEPENELPPADGVYVTEIEIRSFGRRFPSVSNIGRRPTLYEDYATTVETFVLDFSADVYGEKVRLFFLDRLREERKFPSMMDLKAQIQRDIAASRAYFERRAASGAPATRASSPGA